jgi:hypothetical protein
MLPVDEPESMLPVDEPESMLPVDEPGSMLPVDLWRDRVAAPLLARRYGQ